MPTSADLLFSTKDALIDMADALQDAFRHASLDPTTQIEVWHALDDVESEISRIKRAILAIASQSLVLKPPSDQLIKKTADLASEVESVLREAQQVATLVSLVVNISGTVDQILERP